MSDSHRSKSESCTKCIEDQGQQAAGTIDSSKEDKKSQKLECSVCLQKCVYPVCLPCDHIFCFLCIKGVIARRPQCPLCRYRLPPDYCDSPSIMDKDQIMASSQRAVSKDGSQWYYAAVNGGWWQYEDRIAKLIEDGYSKQLDQMRISVSGFQYVVDFKEMLQYKVNDPRRRRKIKRDVISTSKKGVAGIKLETSEKEDSASNSAETLDGSALEQGAAAEIVRGDDVGESDGDVSKVADDVVKGLEALGIEECDEGDAGQLKEKPQNLSDGSPEGVNDGAVGRERSDKK